ncbi:MULTISPECIES: ABC transporter ATP-binding protein [unclassified Gilliamella]|uniref:iron ABC transporter ATP-binding protein n=1 Tax=unclassified Gilliamella TaxID=2685620 RepID=UPI00226AD4CD|nr:MULTISPECIES: ATP-binding cassette domain-containing protein [unclassified Gilliamella]MCX8602363.1 ATP-binding cassette domain-containing protein [Gilliamella sp. B3722]MCX8608536.1 ATP-binding cassette domain-containing protein [Gilliamella sp. B3771]MCX8610346.1 ATP-binding cassette domain-containing protein [Gilliamella sp. B3891]MCX8612986.1 ATP-binding cassette domain-containing protein [Gilliamella sp. B3773]MCX8616523.1 ATP-binding cassette domain-containing protein [Gilliamella sp.
MIEINNISKNYQSISVLKNVNATITQGGITTIIGPNGAGKSTLLSIISRLLLADEGEVKIQNMNVVDTPSDKLATYLSVLRQENRFTSRLTVFDLVGFGRYPYSKGRLNANDYEHIHRALEFLNLTEYKDRFLDELSGGQRQRAYVAMVLCQDTEYVLLDEPLNNLDMKHAVSMMKQLRRAADELGKTIVIVIHDINFASVYSDYILAMKDGKLIYQGEPKQIMDAAILEEIFDTPVKIENVHDQNIAIYY